MVTLFTPSQAFRNRFKGVLSVDHAGVHYPPFCWDFSFEDIGHGCFYVEGGGGEEDDEEGGTAPAIETIDARARGCGGADGPAGTTVAGVGCTANVSTANEALIGTISLQFDIVICS